MLLAPPAHIVGGRDGSRNAWFENEMGGGVALSVGPTWVFWIGEGGGVGCGVEGGETAAVKEKSGALVGEGDLGWVDEWRGAGGRKGGIDQKLLRRVGVGKWRRGSGA